MNVSEPARDLLIEIAGITGFEAFYEFHWKYPKLNIEIRIKASNPCDYWLSGALVALARLSENYVLTNSMIKNNPIR